ncbi:hypothetical protein ACIG3E_32765 [Streptomyces sp. NPDC053474]|uniref:hypothetical protein n=1 Tax=Streptomyces sp. NPDC053474 TaxID=3365704 RepID=UPI0037D16CFC
MPSYSVYVEFDITGVSPDTYEALFDALRDQHGAVGPTDNGNLSVRLTIQAESISQAAAHGIEHAQMATSSHGIAPGSAIRVEVTTTEERVRRALGCGVV